MYTYPTISNLSFAIAKELTPNDRWEDVLIRKRVQKTKINKELL